MSFTAPSAFIGIFLILIGLIIKFELKVITTEEQQELNDRETKKQ